MANKSGSVYGLTILSPILDDEKAVPSHDLQVRQYLSALPLGPESPFALAAGTHMARLVVLDDVIYVGMPACEEHLKSKYLVFESNFDGDLEPYLTGLANTIPTHLDAIWEHCTAYPGAQDVGAFIRYMKACQLETTFYFAAVNDKSVPQTLRALQTQRAVAGFIAEHQDHPPDQLQKEFAEFMKELASLPAPRPGEGNVEREIKTGGRNE
ncbi:MAG TPA: hypothetical protein VE779_04520 [Candidatus Angelobacter sp.]|nr:hypothetical protein [Candidatus Angelobacter sp.]